MPPRSVGLETLGGFNMQFILDKDIYKVARITGPEHNFLGLRFDGNGQAIDVIQLPMRSGERPQIDQDVVLAQVNEGLLEVNDELGKAYSISQIFIVPSDSPSKTVYKFLTIELIKRIDSQGVFLVV
jgi:hypothetical protein